MKDLDVYLSLNYVKRQYNEINLYYYNAPEIEKEKKFKSIDKLIKWIYDLDYVLITKMYININYKNKEYTFSSGGYCNYGNIKWSYEEFLNYFLENNQ